MKKSARKARLPDMPEIPVVDTGAPSVLYGCEFTLSQVESLSRGVVPPELLDFFQRAHQMFTGPHTVGDILQFP